MKIILSKDELEGLPSKLTENVKEEDGAFVYDGTAEGIIEDVAGLKNALEGERENKRKAEGIITKLADKFGADRSNVLSTVDEYLMKTTGAPRKLADYQLKEALRTVKGDELAAPSVMRDEGFLSWDANRGQYVVPGEDGKPLEHPDGTLFGIADAVERFRDHPRFGGRFFKGLEGSGGGSTPGGGEGPGGVQHPMREHATPDNGAPPKSMKIEDMNARQRMLAATVGGGLENYR